ncbi:MAG: glycerate kinase type-2 family protein [Gammaproteobacteria bacterium]
MSSSAAISRARDHALESFRAGIAAVDGRLCVRKALRADDDGAAWYLIALGKASGAMTLGAHDVLGGRIAAALVICPHGYPCAELVSLPIPLRIAEAGHPVPDQASLEAGAGLEQFIAAAPASARFLFLISGGASSLVESLPRGMTLADLVDLNQWLLASGLAIDAVNRVRQAVSCIKGGRLAARFAGRSCRALLISDVPADDAAIIGSGLLTPPAQGPMPELPVELCRRLRFATPAGDRLCGVRVEIVANSERAQAAAAAAAVALGYSGRVEPNRMTGDAAEAGERIARQLRSSAPGARVWGGETTVRLPARAGRGGRCQHFALAAAIALAGDTDCVLLAAGTDGFDGPGEDAGALVDGQTLVRGRLSGLDPQDCLRRADAGAFLEAAGDLISTGATGTNVADLIVGIRS